MGKYMKRLILFLLILLSSCSHEHQHEHQHEHYDLFTLGWPHAYIMRVDPAPIMARTLWGLPPLGVLTKKTRVGDKMRETVELQFSRHPRYYEVVDINLPFFDGTPIDPPHLFSLYPPDEKQEVYTYKITTGCDDPGHTGYIAFRVSWEDGADVPFVYKCPDAAPITKQ